MSMLAHIYGTIIDSVIVAPGNGKYFGGGLNSI